MNLNNLRLSVRLGASFGVVLLLVLAMAAMGIYQLKRIDALNELQAATNEQVTAADNWKTEGELNTSRTMVLAKGGNNSALRSLLDGPIKVSADKITGYTEQLDKVLGGDTERALLKTALDQRKAFTDLRADFMLRLKQGDVAGVEEDADKKLAPLATAYSASVGALSEHLNTVLKAKSDEQIAVSRRAVWLLAGLAAAAVVVGGLLSWLVTRSVTQPLRLAIEASAHVAQGDLTHTITSSRGDELGDLLRSLGTMQHALRDLVGQVRSATDSIGTASSEIATGNADLSSRTEQTASSLEETASAMEQLTGTVKQSADSARQANQLASNAAEVATRGGQVVLQVVATMDEINASSKKIADIIGVIDGIAFQTNILALNAAVEAARAGEQGRGFAVVASEVRSLAQRSANAAKEIKGLIGASVDKVEGGSRLVADAGRTMQEIVGSVQRVSDIIGEISAAAAEQSDGIGQVNTAVVQLDQMTQQNSALVEQSAAAADSLKDQAHRLAEVVGTFKLDDRALASPAIAAELNAAPVRSAPAAVAPGKRAPKAAVVSAMAPASPAADRHAIATVAAPASKASPATAAPAPRAEAVAAVNDEWESF